MTAAPADAEPLSSSASLGQTIESKRPAFQNRVGREAESGRAGGLRRPGRLHLAFRRWPSADTSAFVRCLLFQQQLSCFSPRLLRAETLRLIIAASILLVAHPVLATDPLWVSTTPLEGNRQLLMVVDQQRKVLAVYHVDTTSGTVTLRSTRALGYDLQLDDFNATDPRPSALKKMLQVGGTGQTANPDSPREGGVSIVPAPRSVLD